MLNGKDKQQLLALIEQKGNERKQALYETTKLQTSDYGSTCDVRKAVAAQISIIEENQHNFDIKMRDLANKSTDARDESEKCKNDIRDKEAAFKSGRKEDSNGSAQFRDACRSNEALVTEKVVQNINKILENESPQALVDLLEMFVALLRAKSKSKPADVELFFLDHAKLVSKMSRVSTT